MVKGNTWKSGRVWCHLLFSMLLHCIFIVLLMTEDYHKAWNFKYQNLVFSLSTVTHIPLLRATLRQWTLFFEVQFSLVSSTGSSNHEAPVIFRSFQKPSSGYLLLYCRNNVTLSGSNIYIFCALLAVQTQNKLKTYSLTRHEWGCVNHRP